MTPHPTAAGDRHAEAGTRPTRPRPTVDADGDDRRRADAHDGTDTRRRRRQPRSPTRVTATVIAGTATGDSPCEIASPTPASPGQVGTGEGGGSEDDVGEHGGRGMVVQTPLTKDERVLLEQQMAAARTVVDKYPTVKDATAAGYRMSTRVRAVHRRALHEHSARRRSSTRPTPSELLYDGTGPDAQDRRPQLPRVQPGRRARRLRRRQRPLAPAQRQRRPLLQQAAAPSSAARSMTAEECTAARRREARAHRHLDGARVGRARLRVQLGRVRR